MKSCYYIAVRTREQLDPSRYVSEAGKMVNVLNDVFGARDKILALTKNAELESCHCEVEVSHEDDGLVGKCVVDIEAPNRVLLDKTKLSSLLKATSNWPNMKLEKRQVVQPESLEDQMIAPHRQFAEA